jgi:hypothetical protein
MICRGSQSLFTVSGARAHRPPARPPFPTGAHSQLPSPVIAPMLGSTLQPSTARPAPALRAPIRPRGLAAAWSLTLLAAGCASEPAAPASVGAVEVTVERASLLVGETTQATALLRNTAGVVVTGRSVEWGTLAPGVATVSSTGLVATIGTGAATITATVDRVTGSATLQVAAPAGDIPLTVRAHMDPATQAAYDRIRSRPWWLLNVSALGVAANPFTTVPAGQVQARWTELYGPAAGSPAGVEWEMAERNTARANRDWIGLSTFATAGGLPWIMISMNNFTVPFQTVPGGPPSGGMNDVRNRAAGVLPGGSGHAAYVAYVRQLAQQVKAVGRPVVLRPLHEGNGGWFWWGGNSIDYRALWNLTFQLFQDEGARNVIWMWSVADLCDGAVCNAGFFYPGDASVDILGVDTYFNGTALTQPTLNTLTLLAGMGPDKPLMIAEFGPAARADFWTGAAVQMAQIPRFRGFSLWFARGWNSWAGSATGGSLVDHAVDAATRSAFMAFLADPRVAKLSDWSASADPVP